MDAPIVTSALDSCYPYYVEHQPTENWATWAGFDSLTAAKECARCIGFDHPGLAVRIRHFTGERLARIPAKPTGPPDNRGALYRTLSRAQRERFNRI